MTAEDLRKVSGGVIGHFTPKEIEVDYTALASTGDKSIGLFVPKGKLVIGGYIKNEADDLTSGGNATLQIKVGSTALGRAAAGKTDIKGKAVYQPALETVAVGSAGNSYAPVAVATTAKTEVKVTVGTAGLTAGKLKVGILYI